MTDDDLLALLPPDAAAPLREAIQILDAGAAARAQPVVAPDRYEGLKVTRSPAAATDADALVERALDAVGYPASSTPIPLAAELTPPQRAVVELLTVHPGAAVDRYAMPGMAFTRRRWLGLAPGGVMEREVEHEVDGEVVRGPLWRVLTTLATDDRDDELWARLSVADRLEAAGELAFDAYRLEPRDWERLDEIGDQGREWAPAYADRAVELLAPGSPPVERAGQHELPSEIKWPLFVALARAGVPIEPRWDAFLPLASGTQADVMRECVVAIPADRRGRAVAAALAGEFDREAVAIAIELLPRFPLPEVLERVIAIADRASQSLMMRPRAELLGRVRAACEDPALVRRLDEAIAAAPPVAPVRLGRAFRPRSADELSPSQQRQLAAVAAGWEADEPVLLSAEGEDPPRFGSLEFVSVYELVDAEGRPAYDAYLWLDEDGAAARAGTLEAVAWISQMRLQCDDPSLAAALHVALRQRPPDA